MKTAELTGRALDYAVALAEGHSFRPSGYESDPLLYAAADRPAEWRWLGMFNPSSDAAGDAVIDREFIDTEYFRSEELWHASVFLTDECVQASGATRREAAMRAYVASKLGDEVDIPKELT